ncbi:hypothetical protein K0M31_003911 [Melipona bicolor]|uniref:Uncharacterized protein n=1 Tax=Melipona bicolor TaxID=60889 RepID=A0AA40FYH1_9HYME|nr:hypothetical protein K0M31_003911 [Melipona bicolor]
MEPFLGISRSTLLAAAAAAAAAAVAPAVFFVLAKLVTGPRSPAPTPPLRRSSPFPSDSLWSNLKEPPGSFSQPAVFVTPIVSFSREKRNNVVKKFAESTRNAATNNAVTYSVANSRFSYRRNSTRRVYLAYLRNPEIVTAWTEKATKRVFRNKFGLKLEVKRAL